jgi:septum formation protein
MDPRHLILASFSRARADLLRAAGYAFTQAPSGVHERDYIDGEDPAAYVTFLAQQKAEAVAREFPEAIILAADTTLYLDGHTYGKPTNEAAAVDMLSTLSGKTHDLITGLCIIDPQHAAPRTAHDTARVTLRRWSRVQIEAHVEIAKPLAYAGAYALQQEGCVMVERLEGDPNTVIGLPMGLVETLIGPPD